MTQKIFFGNVEVLNTRTQQKQIIGKVIFKENDSVNNAEMKNRILYQIKANERECIKLVRFCFNTAIHLGNTVY